MLKIILHASRWLSLVKAAVALHVAHNKTLVHVVRTERAEKKMKFVVHQRKQRRELRRI